MRPRPTPSKRSRRRDRRAEGKRQASWRDVIRWFYDTLIAATERQLEGLRSRSVLMPVA
ncbi:MAG: hypothetical protein HY906_12115 [Deltaproteobacteria bacterium]|nr:hypothetical protein [Deltaproteobacteria bacterium]